MDMPHEEKYMKTKRPTIHEIEAFMEEDADNHIEILPNGECRILGGSSKMETKNRKPITMRENLGGEYCNV